MSYHQTTGAYSLHHQGTYFLDDGGSKHLWNVGKFLLDFTAQHPSGQSSSISILFPESSENSESILNRPVFKHLQDYYIGS
jgi:hypothetical protein